MALFISLKPALIFLLVNIARVLTEDFSLYADYPENPLLIEGNPTGDSLTPGQHRVVKQHLFPSHFPFASLVIPKPKTLRGQEASLYYSDRIDPTDSDQRRNPPRREHLDEMSPDLEHFGAARPQRRPPGSQHENKAGIVHILRQSTHRSSESDESDEDERQWSKILCPTNSYQEKIKNSKRFWRCFKIAQFCKSFKLWHYCRLFFCKSGQ